MAEIYALPEGWTVEEHMNPMCDWLRANGIEPKTVPVSSRITVSNGYIATTVFKFNEAGRRYVDQATDEVAQETRIFPLLAPMPEKLRAALLAEEDP